MRRYTLSLMVRPCAFPATDSPAAVDLSAAALASIDGLLEAVIEAMSSSPGLQIAIIEAGGGAGRSIAGGLRSFFERFDGEPAARLTLEKLGRAAAAGGIPIEMWVGLASRLSSELTPELARALAGEPDRITNALRLERELAAWALGCVVHGYPSEPSRADGASPRRQAGPSSNAVRRLFHDLRSPIHALLGITEVLSGGEVEAHSTDGRELLADLRTSARKLASLLEDAASHISLSDEREREQPER